LLDEFIKIGREEFKDETEMAFMNKRVAET
jgi:hypothetical protein